MNIVCQPCLTVLICFDYCFLLQLQNNQEMKVVGENVKFIIIKTGLRARVVARKAPLDESAQQFQPPKDIETL